MDNMKKYRIIVCPECGALYDLHYVNNIKINKEAIDKWECKNCGMVDIVYKNLNDFKEE